MKGYIIAFLLIPNLFFGQGKEGIQGIFTHENDFLGIDNKDENCTGGAKLEFMFPEIKLLSFPFMKLESDQSINVQRISFGGTAYTPQDLASPDVVVGDRPYASLIFVSFGNNFYDLDKPRMLQTEIVAGAMGANGPGSVQAYLHRNHFMGSDRPIPEGWHNQIGNGGKFVLNYNIRYQKIFGKSITYSSTDFFKPSLVAKADIGNYMVDFQGGFKVDLVTINSSILQDYYPNILGSNAVSDEKDIRKKFRMNLYVVPTLRVAPYNATLEGLMSGDHSVYKIDHTDVKRVLFELNAGLSFTFWDFLYLKYSFFGRSREYTDGKSFHTWGGISLGASPSRWFSKKKEKSKL